MHALLRSLGFACLLNACALNAGAHAPVAQSSNAKLYITNQGGASITVVDQTTLSVDTVIDLTKLGFTANAKPHHAAVERDGSFWYATLIGDGKVLKFDRANRLIAQVSMETPGLVAIDPSHDSLYVGRSMTAVNPPKSLGVIRRSTFTLVDEQEIQIPRPHALVVSRDGKWVHAASLAENRFVGNLYAGAVHGDDAFFGNFLDSGESDFAFFVICQAFQIAIAWSRSLWHDLDICSSLSTSGLGENSPYNPPRNWWAPF